MTISDAIKGLRRWAPGGGRRGARPDQAASAVPDVWASVPSEIERAETPISQMLSRIEADACAVYVRHGLPDRPGQYARSPRTEWRFLADHLTVEERWALVDAQRPGSGWRFGSLADLGAADDNPPEVRRASEVLRACAQLRARLTEGGGGLSEDLETAVRLGAAWETLAAPPALVAVPREPLRLTAPATLRPKRESRAKARPPKG